MKTLIADSGSTKTNWIIFDENGKSNEYFSIGMNPYFLNANQIVDELKETFKNTDREEIYNCFFYGSGCSGIEQCEIVKTALETFFINANVEVYNDLLATARALFGNKEGVACILGTGSNAAVFNGSDFVDNIKSLGYILGDEGSGTFIGKKFISDYFHGEMPKLLMNNFESLYDISYYEVLKKVYKEERPNRYLASFAKFASKHREDKYIVDIIEETFDLFIKYQLSTLKFDKEVTEVGFVGSIAYFFKDILEKRLIANNYKMGKIIADPMQNLLEYHKSKIQIL